MAQTFTLIQEAIKLAYCNNGRTVFQSSNFKNLASNEDELARVLRAMVEFEILTPIVSLSCPNGHEMNRGVSIQSLNEGWLELFAHEVCDECDDGVEIQHLDIDDIQIIIHFELHQDYIQTIKCEGSKKTQKKHYTLAEGDGALDERVTRLIIEKLIVEGNLLMGVKNNTNIGNNNSGLAIIQGSDSAKITQKIQSLPTEGRTTVESFKELLSSIHKDLSAVKNDQLKMVEQLNDISEHQLAQIDLDLGQRTLLMKVIERLNFIESELAPHLNKMIEEDQVTTQELADMLSDIWTAEEVKKYRTTLQKLSDDHTGALLRSVFLKLILPT